MRNKKRVGMQVGSETIMCGSFIINHWGEGKGREAPKY